MGLGTKTMGFTDHLGPLERKRTRCTLECWLRWLRAPSKEEDSWWPHGREPERSSWGRGEWKAANGHVEHCREAWPPSVCADSWCGYANQPKVGPLMLEMACFILNKSIKKGRKNKDHETALYLRPFVALAEDQFGSQHPHQVAHNCLWHRLQRV